MDSYEKQDVAEMIRLSGLIGDMERLYEIMTWDSSGQYDPESAGSMKTNQIDPCKISLDNLKAKYGIREEAKNDIKKLYAASMQNL